MSNIQNSRFSIRLPLLLLSCLAVGILLGATIFKQGPHTLKALQGYQKLKEVLSLLSNDYVDTVNTDELVDYSITKMLDKLDPHTRYVPAAEVQADRSHLESGFDGIGVEFNVFKDTVVIVNVLPNGPSEETGLQVGDKIVLVDDKPMFENKKADNNAVFKKLRGVKGSKVKVGILRRGLKDLMNFNITRGKIPQYSIDAAYMVDAKTGYIKISQFREKTYEEFKKSLTELKEKGMSQLMIDLRNNGGGYMNVAIEIIDEVLAGNKLILYTDGKNNKWDQKSFAGRAGIFEKGAVIVLIDESSASASEILAGALQDNDRALVVGRRSFGKGLVQTPVTLEDGSEIVLTISRYYIPSGRSIQKPYSSNGKTEDYFMDEKKRFDHGEFFSADSIKFNDKLKYKTVRGRTVYGGGGIMPDVFVPLDTSFNTRYYGQLYGANVVREYAFRYFADHKKQLEDMNFKDFAHNFAVTDAMLADMNALAAKAGVKYNDRDFQRSKEVLRTQLKAIIARSIFKHDAFGRNNEFYQVMAPTDEIYQKSLTLFGEAAKIENGTFISKK